MFTVVKMLVILLMIFIPNMNQDDIFSGTDVD